MATETRASVMAEAEALLAKITPGTWRAVENVRQDHAERERLIVLHGVHNSFRLGAMGIVREEGVNRAWAFDDLSLIAAAPRLLSALLAVLREQQAELTQLRQLGDKELCPFCRKRPDEHQSYSNLGITADADWDRVLICGVCAEKIADFYGRRRAVERAEKAEAALREQQEQQARLRALEEMLRISADNCRRTKQDAEASLLTECANSIRDALAVPGVLTEDQDA